MKRIFHWLGRSIVLGLGVALLFVFVSPQDLSSSQTLITAPATPTPALGLPPTPPSQRIGLVAGHTGGNDPGAVCPNGVTEAQVNLAVAQQVKGLLQPYGFVVDVLEEFDPRLQDYQALALVSIHADSCTAAPNLSGFKVAVSEALMTSGTEEQRRRARLLKTCLVEWYRDVTGLTFHAQTITRDMSEYHAFREVNPNTPAVIIETGFLRGDYELLVHNSRKVALGIAQGILCYARTQGLRVAPLPSEGGP